MNPAKEIWETAKDILQIEVSRVNYNTWLKDTIGLIYYGNQFVVGTPSTFAAEWLESCLYSLIKKTLISITRSYDIEVQFQVHPHQELTPPALNPNYTFANFIVGSCNRLAYASAMEVTEEPGRRYNPLFIYSDTGLGKTHLIHAIGHAAFANGFRALYASAEQFANEFISAIKERKTEEFRAKFRNADLLLIDDINFLSGKEQTQEGFFHTFNDLYNANRQIVATSTLPPKGLPLFEPRLCSRFEWGLVTDIRPPDLETRSAILRTKAEQQGVNIDALTLRFIAQQCQENIRELEGCLNRLIAHSKLTRQAITIGLVQQLQQEKLTRREKISPNEIITAVANYFNLSLEELQGRRREKKINLARQVTIYLLQKELQCNLSEIGEMLGSRASSVISQGCRNFSIRLKADPTLQQTITEIKLRLKKS